METFFSEILDKHYNQSVINITEQQGGWSARAFRVDTTSGSYFLKAYEKHKASTEKWTAMIDTYMPIVLWLDNNTNLQGKISCPVLTNDGQYKCEDNHFIFLLFPYIEGYTSLAFYQIRRRLEDICAFAQGLLYEDIDDEERRQSLYHLRRECSILS